MPDLPVLTVSQEHYDRIVAAFPGATPAAKATAYRQWLRNRLIEFVRRAEQATIHEQVAALENQLTAQLLDSLPPAAPEIEPVPVSG